LEHSKCASSPPPELPSRQRARRDGCVHYLSVYVRGVHALKGFQIEVRRARQGLHTRTFSPEPESGQFRARVSSAYSTTRIPRPRAESSLKYGNGSNAVSGGMTPFCLTNPFTSHWAAIEGGTPVSTTPPPTFHFLCGHVTASYRKVRSEERRVGKECRRWEQW